VIFVPYWGDAPGEDVKALQTSPLWTQLNAVKKNQAHIISGEEWFGLVNKPVDASWTP
jgi:ABC-type Fe3+-hydroxamate transport system substrate-binding protein